MNTPAKTAPVRKPRRKNKSASIDFGRSKLTKSLTFAYILALSIIAILTIVGHFVTEQISNRLMQGAEITYSIGRQRALVQQTSTYAQKYFQTRDRIEFDLLNTTINDMEKGHKFLSEQAEKNDQFGKKFSDILYEAYHTGKQYGAQVNQEFIIDSKQFVNLPMSKDREMERKDLLAIVTGQKSRTLITTFDIVLEDYQAELLQKISKAYMIQSWSATLVILILILEAAFIFRPLVRRIKEYHHLLLKEAMEDHLTGLYNRRAFLKRSLMELSKARRDKTPTTIVLTDLDHFKSVNDRYGHKVGDLVLKHFADLARESFRSADVTGRIGGEEFAFVLPVTGKDKGFQVIERFRLHICANPCYYPDEKTGTELPLAFTASFGVIINHDHTKTIESLLALADELLYEAKKAGRNCVIVKEIEPPVQKKIQHDDDDDDDVGSGDDIDLSGENTTMKEVPERGPPDAGDNI